MPASPYDVCLVTHDSAGDLPDCLAAVGRLEPAPRGVALVDSGSADGSARVARRAAPEGLALHVEARRENVGFAAGMNLALTAGDAPWVLLLNADARPEPEYVARLLAAAEAVPGGAAGAVTGRLVRFPEAGRPDLLDACGMRLTLAWRHLDRGSGEPDRGQLAERERVFGATGAASLFRRRALEDVALDGEAFAEEFHSFREDAELAFRLRERGWEVVYEPAARARHRRRVVPERRRRTAPAVNLHSLKNRFLLRAYHATAGNLALTLVPTLLRDLAALAWVVVAERSSLPALAWLGRHRRRILARRRSIQGRRTVPARRVDRWFLHRALPL